MISVKRKKNEPFEAMLRRFKRAYNDSGIALELFERRHYVKPSIRKRKRKRKSWGR